MAKIVCFGEVLWDVFPEYKKIGGAPLNVALRSASFNNNVIMISAVGNDALGNKLIDFLLENHLNIGCIQINDTIETGVVNVFLNDKGSASYEIKHPSAWDKISITEASIDAVKASDAFVFGSLITRDEMSRETLYKLIELANYKVFDLNLRPPHYSNKVLQYLMNKADFIKFNDDELYEVCGFMGSQYNSLEQNLNYIAEKTNTKHICVTKGEHGAVLLYNGKLYYNSGYQIKVKNTVGAGDSFLGSLISQLLNNVNPQEAINFACAVGALVAQEDGANPKISKQKIEAFINP